MLVKMCGEYVPSFDQVQEKVFGQRPKDITEERIRLAVCKILRGQDKRIVGCGVLVCDPGINDHISKYCIITSREEIKIENFLDGSINQVKFSKKTKEMCFDLKDFSKSVQDLPSAGLILIFIDANHRDFKHIRCLPMTNLDQDQQPFCYLANQCYNIVKSSGENGEYVLEAASSNSDTSVKSTITPDEIPNGTVILQGANEDVRAVGVFNVVDRNNLVVSPIWLKSSISGILADTSTSADGPPTAPLPAVPSSDDFEKLLEQIKCAADKGFGDLERMCASIKLPSLKLDEETDICWNELSFDAISEELLPADTKKTGYRALKTEADGNCLFRSASIFAFGDEEQHVEMRLRTVLELVLNSRFYQEGEDVKEILLAETREIHPNSGKSFSKLSDEDVKRQFEWEVQNNSACLGDWGCYWHLQALGTVLNRQIRSVYPDNGGNEIRKYFNAIIRPRRSDTAKEPLTFMWTHTDGGDASQFRPNHFVPLIPVFKILAASRKNQKTKDLQKDENDNENPASKENQKVKDLQKDEKDNEKPDSYFTSPKTECILNITVATTAEGWNIKANEQLVIELAKNPRLKVYGLVPRSTQEQRDLAKKSNIELVDAKKRIGCSKEELIAYPPDDLDIDILIMHSYGRDLGKQAQDIKEKKKCKWVHVVHTISEELEKYMKVVSTTDTADPDWLPEHELQVALSEAADLVIATGPKVAEAYKVALRHCGKHKSVITMTPEIIHDLAGVQTVYEGGEKFHVMISATYPSKSFEAKGCDIAAKAITLLKDSSYHLTFVVLPNDDAEVLKSKLKGLISLSQFTVKHVSRSTENWRKQLCQVNLVVLPSAEGFGTSCVRAISAGVPVLSSGNSGFGMALKKLPSGEMHVLDSEDPQEWAYKIRELRDKGPTQLAREAKQLRKEYMREYCWKDQCDKLVDKLMDIVRSKEESQNVGAEHTEKITQAVTYAESRMQQTEVEKLREQEHDTADDVTKRVQELDLGDKNPDSRMGQEKGKCVESELDKLHMPQREEGIGVTRTSVEETGVTDQKSDSLAQKNIAHDAVDAWPEIPDI